jgi:general secretion pathway protein L
MLKSLLTWWTEQMRDLFPASLHFSGKTWRQTLVVTADGSDPTTMTFSLLIRGKASPLSHHNLTSSALREVIQRMPSGRRRTATLRVTPDLFLERETIVPAAAEHDLKRVIGYDMDRLTPFQANEVFWTCAITKRDNERNRLHVRVAIVPRIRLQITLDALQSAGIVPVRIEADGTTGQQNAISLIEPRSNGGWFGPRTNTFALGTCGILAAVAIALPFVLQSVNQATLDARIDAMKPQVTQAEALRKKLASSATMTDVTTVARTQVGAPLQFIASLTDVLPDDTFLTTISLRQRKLTISGRSAAAARLIGAMVTNPMIRNPAFAAPVIRDETNGGESFSIRADLGS